MYNHKIAYTLLLVLSLLCTAAAIAQENVKSDPRPARRKPAFMLHIGAGIATYAATVNVRRPIELPGSINKLSGAATIRLMWYPRYRLRLGIESGFTNFYTYRIKNGNTEGRVSLNAIPLLVVWQMQVVPRLNIYAGFGSYFLNTHLTYNGDVNSSAIVLGSNLAVAYSIPISKRTNFAVEAKWMNAFETKDAAFSIQVQLARRLFQWD